MASKYQYVTEFTKLVGQDYPEGPQKVQGYLISHHVREDQEARYLLDWGPSLQQFVVCRHPHSAIPCLAAQGIIPTATIAALPESATSIAAMPMASHADHSPPHRAT